LTAIPGYIKVDGNFDVKIGTRIWGERKKSGLTSGQLAGRTDKKRKARKLVKLQNRIFFQGCGY
jgi:hypothetical protein